MRKTTEQGVFSNKTTKYLEDDSWVREINDFARHILDNETVADGSSRDALRSMELVQAIYSGDENWGSG